MVPFSDLHFRAADDFDRERVLSSLWDDIGKQILQNLLPDFVLFTGDVSHSGRQAEFAKADDMFFVPLIERTGIRRDRLFLVPGNHDFDRKYLERLNPATIRSLASRSQVNDFVSDEGNVELYLSPFGAYDKFVRSLTQSGPEARSSWGYSHLFEASGLPVSVVGLNSAWSCGYHLAEAESSDEKGSLLLGEKQFIDAIGRDEGKSVRIVLMHHPLDWFAEFEIATMRREILMQSHFLHHGHVHQPSELSARYSQDQHCFVFGAAACYDRRVGNDHYANGYSIVVYDMTKGTVTLRVRKYVDSPTPHWTSHEDLLGEGTGGQHSFPLPALWLDSGHKPAGEVLSSPTSLDELYRSSPLVAQNLPSVRPALDDIPAADRSAVLVLLYEQLLCSVLASSASFGAQTSRNWWAAAGLLGEAVVRFCASHQRSRAPKTLSEATTRAADLLDEALLSDFRDELSTVVFICQATFEDWTTVPYGIAQDYNVDIAEASATCALIAATVVFFSDAGLAARTAGLKGSVGPDRWSETVAVPARGRMVSGNIAEITTTAEDAGQFMALTMVRFHLEQRIKHVTEAFASVSRDFPLQAVRLQLLNRPEFWTEQRFTVDTSRIIALLMGKELYGEKAGDVWFRELLQNAVDAYNARQRIEPDAPSSEIEVLTDPVARKVSVRDNGIGMSRWHIDRFFCRVGRSVWRSKELAQYFDDKTAKNFSLGKFGVGFLSVFEVSEHVTVTTRFCLEDHGYQLRISSMREPFFVRQVRDAPVGTEVSLRFKDGVKADLAKIARRYLVYRPQGVAIKGLPVAAASAWEALESALSGETFDKGVKWFIAGRPVSSLNGELYVAVPMSRRDLQKPGDSFPGTGSVRVSNGGISVYDVSGEWLGEQERYGENPKSGVRGVRGILDFPAGTAPVTVSRNGIRISDGDARSVLDAVVDATWEAWDKFAEDLFATGRNDIDKTRGLMRALNNSARPPSYYREDKWCDSDRLQSKAVALLLERGTLEVLSGKDLEVKTLAPIGELQEQDTPLLLSTREQAKKPLFRLYRSQLADARVVVVADKRSIELLHACEPKWVRVRSEQDIWSVITLRETKTWNLCSVMPPEFALVPREYFTDDDLLAIGLPRRRARADQVVGLHRNEATSIPARVLLNEEHEIWRSLEQGLNDDRVRDQELEDVLQQLQSQVFDEKTKGRRDAHFRRLHSRLARMADVSLSVTARVEV